MEKMKECETFSTTADVGIRIRGRTYKDFFKNAIKGLNLLIFDNESSSQIYNSPIIYPFDFKGDGLENVLVNFLSEVIFLLYSRNRMTVDINFEEVSKNHLKADLVTFDFNLEPGIEIKSVTYHNFKVIEEKGIKYAEIIFDI